MGLSQEEQVQDAATNQVDSQGKRSAQASSGVDRKMLSEVFAGVEATLPAGASSIGIRQVAYDSRKVQPSALFFALHGAKADGNAFIRDAIQQGAVAIASEDAAPGTIPAGVTWVQVREARKALAMTAANFLGHPANALQLVAVTGTNGKTTTTSVVDAIVKASGAKAGLFGTIAYMGTEPASGAFALPIENALYVGWVATSTNHRRRGLAELVIRASLEDARKATGLERTVLHATDAGLPVYQRMGYRSAVKFPFYGPQ